MVRPAVHPVILSGGAGARLWPLSRTLRPKQVLPLTGSDSLLQQTIQRTVALGLPAPLIICNHEHRFLIAEQVRALALTQAPQIVLEPAARNTAAAAIAAALLVQRQDPAGLVLLLPADHIISTIAGLNTAVQTAADAARQGFIVTFGVPPRAPETGYGYIRAGEPCGGIADCHRIARFVEKPDAAAAAQLFADGRHFWNSGIFLFAAPTLLAEVERLQPALLDPVRRAVEQAVRDLDFLRLDAAAFSAAPAISLDYAVMELTDRGAVVRADLDWSDVGSWQALWERGPADDAGNVCVGETLAVDAAGCYLRGDGALVAVLGVADLIVVASDDAVLVAPRGRAQEVRRVVEAIEQSGRREAHSHRQVFRPWGWYRLLHGGARFQVKEILVQPGHRLSRQLHHHRAEHWVVVSGTAKVTRGNEVFYITEDQSTYIPHNTPHTLENPGRIPLRMIEVQSGPYLGEDDIIRFDDAYGRPLP
jgi:mannose-1-phosphate guanylyltransferase/mannose-6-phosphate isomerase